MHIRAETCFIEDTVRARHHNTGPIMCMFQSNFETQAELKTLEPLQAIADEPYLFVKKYADGLMLRTGIA